MPALPRYRLLLADDHAVFRSGLKSLLHEEPDFEVVAETASGAEVLGLVQEHRPDLVVLDVQMPGLSGPDVVRQLRSAAQDVRVIGLSAFDDAAYVERFARCGATGYVTKSRPPHVIVEALREAAQGEPVWLVRQPLTSPLYRLTEREREVLVLLAQGKPNEEISTLLRVSDSSIRNTLTIVYQKIDVPHARAAIAWAWKNKLVEDPKP